MRQPYRIESVTLKDVGVFNKTHFDFPQIENENEDAKKAEIHIFTGPNGCGKSTLLYALAGILNPDPYKGDALVRKRYRGVSSKVDFRFFGASGGYGVKAIEGLSHLLYNNDEYYYRIPHTTSHAIWENRPSIDNSQNLTAKKFDYVALAYSGNRAVQAGYDLSAIQNITQSPFENALSFDQTVRPQLLAQWIANNRTQAALARNDGDDEEAKQYDNAISHITGFVNDICQLGLTFHLKRSPLQVTVDINGVQVSLNTLPEGLKSIISWIADMSLRLGSIPWKDQRDIFSQPIILFLDEVDIHLHPKWQRRILPAIQKLLPNAQVFVSTHSPFVVGSVEDAFVYRLPEPDKKISSDISVPETIPFIKSGAGKSYQMILTEIFDVEEEFDIETERQLADFKDAIRQHLTNPHDDSHVMTLAHVLREKSEELATLVSMELRQMNRLLSKK